MTNNTPLIYGLNENIAFRCCSLFSGKSESYGDCTNFDIQSENYDRDKYYYCKQRGIHLHCRKHPEIEYDIHSDDGYTTLSCPKCGSYIEYQDKDYRDLINKCFRMLNIKNFKNAKMIKLDDWYVAEIKGETEHISDYWLKTEVKTDSDGDTIVIVYVGHQGDKEKVQYFIKPEKGQLTSDHHDLDPAKILAKIEVTLKGRRIIHEYDDEPDL